MANKTKIIATIGPASNSRSVLKKMILAGMNVARLNFSHGTHKEHGVVINRIRSLSAEMNRPVGILADLQGPKIRTGRLKDGLPVMLKKNGTVCITTKDVAGSSDLITTTYTKLVQDVKKGATILIDDGLIELRVLSRSADSVFCKVINAGILKENKGINLPQANISAPSLTEKDRKDLVFGIKSGVDFFALSFVRSAVDLTVIKSLIKKHQSDIPVIAKIEKPEAVQNFDAILKVTDAVMVARGDLGVEVRPEQVPTIQKQLIHKAALANKPVITATQMLETMSSNPVPTRAEASDVANAIFDGTDAVMLSGETASGLYPVRAVKMMSRIAAEAERSPFMKYNIQHEKDLQDPVPHAVAQSAVNILHELDAKAIVAFSMTGSTARLISKQRPFRPVYTFTPGRATYNRLSLVWGITPLLISRINDTKHFVAEGEKIMISKKILKKNDLVIIVTGRALKSGATNLIKIHRIGQED